LPVALQFQNAYSGGLGLVVKGIRFLQAGHVCAGVFEFGLVFQVIDFADNRTLADLELRFRQIGLRLLERGTAFLGVIAMLRLFLLHDSRYSTMAAFSKGMRQRVLLAAALLHNPDLLVLDEPFSGLDVNAALLFQSLIRMFVAEGRMILFSTHRFDMVEKLCSRAVILSKGRLVAEHAIADTRAGESASLEQLFVRVTDQQDFAPVAREILDVMRDR